MNRNDLLATAGETLAYAEDYVDTRLELLKLDLADRGSRVAATAMTTIILMVCGLFAQAALSIALALWLGRLLDGPALGFLLVGGLYLILAGLLYMLRDRVLTTPILQALVASLFKPAANEQPRQ